MTKAWWTSCALPLLIGAMNAASAQTAAAPLADAGTAGDDEIVITAARREGSVQRTALAVSAFDPAALARQQVFNVKDLNLASPNIAINNGTGQPTALDAFIRGVGQDDSSFTAEPAVGLYLDGVYLARTVGGLASIYDLDRIEVLRGPQGTLYGRNSSAGAIRFFTKRPELGQVAARARGIFGSYDRRELAGAINLPLGDTAALRVSGQTRQIDGFVKVVNAANVDTGQRAQAVDQQSARLSLLWQPTETVELFVTGDLFNDQSGPVAITSTDCGNTNFAVAYCPLRFGSPYRTGQKVPDLNHHRQRGTQATIVFSGIQGVKLQSISAYRRFHDRLAIDLTGDPAFAFNLLQDLYQKQVSQELILSSDGSGPFGWTLGGIYFREKVRQDALYFTARNVDRQDSRSWAAFVEGRYSFGGGVTAFAGIRYTEDRKRLDRRQALPSTRPLGPTLVGRFRDEQWSPRIGVEWQATPDVFFYGTYAKGYKPGGFAEPRPSSAVGATASFGSETVDSYEVGARTSWFDRRLVANLTLFTARNDNLSQGILTGSSFIVVTGDARFRGLEFEGRVRPVDGLEIFAVVGLLDDKFVNKPVGAQAGDRLKNVPRNHEKIGALYAVPIGADVSIFAGGNLLHSGSIFRNLVNDVNIRTGSYTTGDAQVGVQGGRWKVTGGVQNIADKAFIEQGVSFLGRYYSRPRTYSLTLELDY